jgi:hypothetical protein
MRRILRARWLAWRARLIRRFEGQVVAQRWAADEGRWRVAQGRPRAVSDSAPCSPLPCQGWDIYDWQWWYFECWLPPCHSASES